MKPSAAFYVRNDLLYDHKPTTARLITMAQLYQKDETAESSKGIENVSRYFNVYELRKHAAGQKVNSDSSLVSKFVST